MEEPKRRGRKPKTMTQESTVLEDSEGMTELSRNISRERKVRAGSDAKKNTIQQEVRWNEIDEQSSRRRSQFTEDSHSDWERPSSSERSLDDRRRWRIADSVPSTSYEWLGLRTVEPVSRPPILKLNGKNSARVAWVGRECSLAGAALRRARPVRPLEAAFFDRIEAMRRVALSEVAKAKDGMEAVAVLGVVFDREMLLLAAEEVYGQTRGKSLVMDAAPGTYDELAANIASDRRPRRFTRRRDNTSRVEAQKAARGQSKPALPYVPSPFRQGGTEVLHNPRCPGEEGVPPTGREGGRRGHWLHEQELEEVEGLRSTSDALPVAPERSPLEVDWWCPTREPRAESWTDRWGHRGGDEATDEGWCVYSAREGRRGDSLPGVHDSKAIRGDAPHPRLAWNQRALGGSPLFNPGMQRRGDSRAEQRVALCPRSQKGIPTGPDGQRGQEVFGRKGGRRDRSLSSPPFRAFIEPIHLYSTYELDRWNGEEEDGPRCSSVHRRLLGRCTNQGSIGEGPGDNKEAVRRAGCHSLHKEAHRGGAGSRVLGVPMVREEEDYWPHGGAKKRILESCEEFTEDRASHKEMENSDWEVDLLEGGHRANITTCKESHKAGKRETRINKDKGNRRSREGFNMVERGAVKNKRDEPGMQGSDRFDSLGCVRGCSGLQSGIGWDKNPEDYTREGGEEPHKCPRARSAARMLKGPGGFTQGQTNNLVLRQYLCKGSREETGLATRWRDNVARHERGPRHHGREEHQDHCEACAWLPEQGGRRAVETNAGRRGVEGGTWENNGQVGPVAARPMWDDEGVNGTSRGHSMEPKQDVAQTGDMEDPRSDGIIGTSGRQGEKNNASFLLGVMCGAHNAHMAEGNMVEHANKVESGLDGPREDPGRETRRLEVEEQTRSLVDGVFNTHKDALWAERTESRYRSIARGFIGWYLTYVGRNGEKELEEEMETMARKIGVYLETIATSISGENLNMTGKILMKLFGAHLTDIDKKTLETLLKRLRRLANQRNPPANRAADALRLEDLHNILESPKYPRLSRYEKEAVDILVVAFATLSRVAEITSLTIRDVSEDGHHISVRTKTQAATCIRHVKYVSDALGLYPTRVLRSQRTDAILHGRTLLYSARAGEDVPIGSSEVTRALKQVTETMGMSCRITAHSGRKGAAVAALLAGAPIVMIQSLGLWRCIDSMQAYLGEALRQGFCVLDLLRESTYKTQ